MSDPLHISIAEKLRHQIQAGDYQPGDKLPSEHQLMDLFQVSRITIRRAIANLVNQGLVQSQQGKGVFVTLQRKVTYTLSSPLLFLEQDMARKSIHFTFKNLVFEPVPSPADIASILDLDAHTLVYLQKKVLYMDGTAGAVDISYILSELGQQLAPELKHQMTFPTLENHGIIISHIDAVIECTHADYEMGGYLDVSLGQPLIMYRYTTYTTGHQPILYGMTISRADRFCYAFTLQK